MQIEKIIVDGVEIAVDLPKFICLACGSSELRLRQVKSNNSYQMRCSVCNKFFGNFAYTTPETFLMPFGKYKGKKLMDLPQDYLVWLQKNCINLGGNIKQKITEILK